MRKAVACGPLPFWLVEVLLFWSYCCWSLDLCFVGRARWMKRPVDEHRFLGLLPFLSCRKYNLSILVFVAVNGGKSILLSS